MIRKLRLLDTVEISPACPAEWSANTTDGRPVHIYYRFGRLTVEINFKAICCKQIGTPTDGLIDLNTAMLHAGYYLAA